MSRKQILIALGAIVLIALAGAAYYVLSPSAPDAQPTPELAREILKRPTLLRRYTRVALTHELRRLLHTSLGYGLALEGLAAIDHLPKPGEFNGATEEH